MSNDDMRVTRGSATRSRAPMLGEDVSFGYAISEYGVGVGNMVQV